MHVSLLICVLRWSGTFNEYFNTTCPIDYTTLMWNMVWKSKSMIYCQFRPYPKHMRPLCVIKWSTVFRERLRVIWFMLQHLDTVQHAVVLLFVVLFGIAPKEYVFSTQFRSSFFIQFSWHSMCFESTHACVSYPRALTLIWSYGNSNRWRLFGAKEQTHWLDEIPC